MQTKTIKDLNDDLGLDVLGHLDLELDIPVDDTPSAQGDLLLVPLSMETTVKPSGKWEDIPKEGIVLIAGTHDHTLFATGRYARATSEDGCATHMLSLDDVGVVHHIEHGYRQLAPGEWSVRRQQEGSMQRRRKVAD